MICVIWDHLSSKIDVSCILAIVICNIFGSALQGQLCCSNLCLCEVLDASQFNICIAEFNVNVWTVQQPAAEFSVQCWSRPQQTEDRSSLSLKRHLTVLPPYSTTNKHSSEYICFFKWQVRIYNMECIVWQCQKMYKVLLITMKNGQQLLKLCPNFCTGFCQDVPILESNLV